VQGNKYFSSGEPTRNRTTFLYTFYDPGVYTVASVGAPGYSCQIEVIETSE